MKWCIEDTNISTNVCNKLKESINRGDFSKEIFDVILKHINSNIQLTFRSDNLAYIDKLVNKIVGLCYVKNFLFDIANDNHKSLYKSSRIKHNQPKDRDKSYFTFSKVTFPKDLGTSYHFHFSQFHNNSHLLLVHDNNIL